MARSSKKQDNAGADKSHRRSTAMEKEAPLPPPLTNSIGGTNLQDWWASTPSHLSPTNGGFNPRPPGGFLNYLQSSQYPPYTQQQPENFHFVGVPASYAPHSSQAAQGGTMAASELGTPRFEHQPTKDFINLDVEGDIEPTRTDKRLPWTHEEDIRLASAWLENSNDPINGNCKKNDQYWSDVIAAYNSNTPSNRRREGSQVKICWHKVSTKISHFNACYLSVKQVYVSGRSDKEVMADALLKYEDEHHEPFKLLHWWEVLKNEPKWHTYCEMLNKEKHSNSPSIVLDVDDTPRPEGCKAAKDKRNGKRKMPELATRIQEELEKFMKAQTTAREDRDGMKEFQLSISSEKIEAAKLRQQAEKEKKERKMLDAYKELLLANTSGMSEDEKSERMRALRFMSSQLFSGEK